MMDRVLRFPEVKRLTGLSRTTIWEQEKAGRFPRHIQISPRAVGWLESHISSWLEALANGPAEQMVPHPNLRAVPTNRTNVRS